MGTARSARLAKKRGEQSYAFIETETNVLMDPKKTIIKDPIISSALILATKFCQHKKKDRKKDNKINELSAAHTKCLNGHSDKKTNFVVLIDGTNKTVFC